MVGAPILIHLLARRRFKRIRWAAMDFLLDAQRRNKKRLRMEEWILLALRCLAVLFIATMIGRPFFKPTGVSAMWGGSQRTERVFLIDDSMSMAYETPEGQNFERAKEAVRRLIDTIRQETPDDTVTILRMSAPDAPLDAGTYLDETQTQELLERVDALTPTLSAINPSQAIESVVQVIDRNSELTNVALYLISDFQRNDWVSQEAEVGEADGESAVMAPLVEWAKHEHGLHVMLIDLSIDDPVNQAVSDLRFRGGQLVAGTNGSIRITVANFSDSAVENVALEVTVGNLVQPGKSIRQLAPGQQATVDLEVLFARAGYESIKVELPSDNLLGDNRRFATTEVVSAVRVLIVNGESSSDSFADEVTYLSTALRPEGEVFSGNEVVIVDEAELDGVQLSTFHVVVLANVYRISEPAVESLERFVKGGGGMVIFLGDQVDPDLYNTALYREGEGLLPASITEQIRAPEIANLVVTDRLHPAMRGLSVEGDPLGIGQISFFRYFACHPHEVEAFDDDPLPLGTTSRRNRKRPARVVARFNDASESPAIVERPFGAGRVVLITTTADKEWHNWPDHPTFLPIMMELMRHVTRRSDRGEGVWVGQPILLPLAVGAFEPEALVRTPAYPNEREVIVTATPSGDGTGLVFRWDHTMQTGLYEFRLKSRDGGDVSRLVAVNTDPLESDLIAAEEVELRNMMGDLSFEYVKGLDALSGVAGDARVEFWRLFLFMALIALMLEQFLAWRWGRRR